MRVRFENLVIIAALLAAGCPTEPPVVWECQIADGADPDFAQQIGCRADFDALASAPLNASIPGARSGKTVLDRIDSAQYFQNSTRYPIHWDFATEHLSAPDHPPVPNLAQFNSTEYYSPSRRFLLGAVTWYEGPQVWAWEIAPYDTADADMITTAFRSVADNSFMGEELRFHPTSVAIENVALSLPDTVPTVSTDELFAGIDYQPLNLASSMGRLRFVPEEETDSAGFREIVVLQAVPNDIPIVAGIVTQAFQTPLSHINVLSQNRGTPNMGLRGAWEHADLRALEGQWVELTVGAFDWQVRQVTEEEADDWWDSHRPDPIDVGPMDTSIETLTDIEDVLDLSGQDLEAALAQAIPAFGGKVSHFAGLAQVDEVPTPDAFGVPVYFFDAFMEANGLWTQVEALLADPDFLTDLQVQRAALAELRAAIEAGTVDPTFEAALMAKLEADFPNTRMRFRSSTNAEDIGGFNGAGLYTSRSGDPNDPKKPVLDAVRTVWASVYSDRAFAERQYYGIEHRNIGMALLVHRSFPNEDANGVAITANIFDTSGLEPGFYVNVQEGGESVVLPDPEVTTDQFLYYYLQPGSPIVYLAHSNLVDEGETVLTAAEAHELGDALIAVHQHYQPIYGQGGGFYGMDVEFKFDSSDGGESRLFVKQARPYTGRADPDGR